MTVEAWLVVGEGCPHCAVMRQALSRLLQEGGLARLEVVRAHEHPGLVAQWGIRSVPWLRLGPFVLEGRLTVADLRRWLARVEHPKGMALYFDHLFASGRRKLVEEQVRQAPPLLTAFVQLLEDPEVGINTRLGVGAVLEELRGSGLAEGMVAGLAALTRHPDARIRGDACYYLSLTGSPRLEELLRPCLQDPNPEVREVAREILAGEI